MQSTKKIQIVLLTIASLVLANAASAKVLSMTGSWFQNRGPLIDIPQKGGAVPCGTFPGAPVGPGLENGCVNGLAPLLGGIPGNAPLVVNGSAPADFTIPTDAFSLFPGTAWVGAVAVVSDASPVFRGPAAPPPLCG